MKIRAHIVPVVLMSSALFALGGCSGDAKKGRVIAEEINNGTAEQKKEAKKAACIAAGGSVSGDFCYTETQVKALADM